MTATQTKVLDFNSTETTPFVVPYILIPENHSLCYYTFDHTKTNVYVHLYVPDPQKKLTLKIRGDEIESNATLLDDFYREHCRSCEYLFDYKDEETEERNDDGNIVEITRTIRSCCDCERYGLGYVVDDSRSDCCVAGHTLPELNESEEEYEWTEEIVDSTPMYYMLRIDVPDNRYDYLQSNLSAAVAFAEKILSPDKSEYVWYISGEWKGLNIYEGKLPSGICWGSDANRPKTVHLDEACASYVSSVFNDDILDYESYVDVLGEVESEYLNVADFNELTHNDADEYRFSLDELIEDNSGRIVTLNNPLEVIISDSERPAAGFIHLSRAIDAPLFNRMYVSGVSFDVVEPLNFNTVLLPIYKYEYVNPNNSEQRINGYVTKPSSSGFAWFLADTIETFNSVHRKRLPVFNTPRYRAYSEYTRQNHLTVFGQIQL